MQTLSEPVAGSPVTRITGALTGIGRGTALAFARNGARVVVSGRRDHAGAVHFTRVGTPDEIADAIVFVASPQAAFITGQTLDVNGGKAAS